MLLQLNTELIEKEAEKQGLNKTNLAKKLGISRMHLDRILSGSTPGNKAISAFLGVFNQYSFKELFFLPGVSQNSDTNKLNSTGTEGGA